jgi:acyl carrier protein
MKGYLNMKKSEIIEFLINKIAELLMVEPDEIEVNASLTDELGVDSLDMQELYITISDKYKINYNLIKIINDVAVILSYDNGLTNDEKYEKIEETMKLSFNEDDKKDFLIRMESEPSSLLLKRLQSYVTVDLLASSIEKIICEA